MPRNKGLTYPPRQGRVRVGGGSSSRIRAARAGYEPLDMPYIQDAEREGDEELADLFRPAQTERAKGDEQARTSSAGT